MLKSVGVKSLQLQTQNSTDGMFQTAMVPDTSLRETPTDHHTLVGSHTSNVPHHSLIPLRSDNVAQLAEKRAGSVLDDPGWRTTLVTGERPALINAGQQG